jgi:hypothetical protein
MESISIILSEQAPWNRDAKRLRRRLRYWLVSRMKKIKNPIDFMNKDNKGIVKETGEEI